MIMLPKLKMKRGITNFILFQNNLKIISKSFYNAFLVACFRLHNFAP